MKNSDKHVGLSESFLRDWISKTYRNNKKIGQSEASLKRIDESIIQLQKEKESIIITMAMITLSKSKGWVFFDDSDDIEDYDSSYFVFLGTDEEFKKIYNREG